MGNENRLRHRRWESAKRNKTTLVGIFLSLIILVIAILAPLIIPYDPDEQFLDHVLEPPGKFFFGTDSFGRDILSRVLIASRVSVTIGFVSVIMAAIIGTPIGIFAGYFGGWTDNIITRFVDIIMSFPSLLIAIIVVAALGPGFSKVTIAICVGFIPRFIRLARGSTLSVKEKEFILSSKSIGAKDTRTIFIHCLPNILGDITVMATLWIAVAIRIEANLSFLGIGVQPPTASWGSMIGYGVDYLFSAPLVSVIPGMAILITTLSFNLIGDGIRDIIDPRLS